MATLIPPQPAPTWTHTPVDILRLTKDALAQYKAVEDEVASLSPESCNFESVFLALAHAEAQRTTSVEPLTFLQNVSPSQAIRDASAAAEGLLRDFRVDSSARIDVFRAKQAAQRNIEQMGVAPILSPEERRLVEKMILDGTRAGLALPEAERERLVRLQKELAQASIEFRTNITEENGKISFTLEQLEGVPADSISRYTKRTEGENEVYDVTFQMSDWGPITRFAVNPETRRIAYGAYESRLAVNAPILSTILDLRRQIARLLGYASWADYVTEVKMVKTAKGVEEFLADLEQRLRPVGLADHAALLALKEAEHAERGLPFDGALYVWDASYYDRRLLESRLGLDVQRLKEHFPVPHVVPAMLAIYQELFELEFVEAEGETWHPDVKQYAVWEKGATDASGFVGHCYMDLYARENKFPGAAVWPLIPGCTTPTGTRQYPVATIVASLGTGTDGRPALMGHFDVKTLFHELGHVFHELLSVTRFSRFHGTTGALDFAEAPSQMLENWCYEPKVLQRMSRHYETGKPLDADFIDKILKSRYTNVGMFNLRQLSFAAFDLRVHLSEAPADADYTKLWSDIRESIALLKTDEPRPGQAAFQHLVGDYSVGYYGYTYSLVFAADMYETVFKEDPLDPARGRRYREKILVPGSSKDEMDLLKDFLGREPTSEAFLQQLFGQ